jgi:hypothetical protein
MVAKQFGMQVDEFGGIVGEGGPSLETAHAHSDLAAQLWDQNRKYGVILSPQQVVNRVQQAAYGHTLSRSEVEQEVAQDLGEDAEPGAIDKAVDDILQSEYRKVRQKLIEMESGDNWLSYVTTEGQDDATQPEAQPGVQPDIPGQDQVLNGAGENQPEPARRTLGLNYESDSPTPIGRAFDTVNQAIGTAPTPPAGPGKADPETEQGITGPEYRPGRQGTGPHRGAERNRRHAGPGLPGAQAQLCHRH